MPQNVFPIFKGAIYNTTKAENTAFFASDLTPTTTPTTFLIYYAANANSGYPQIRRTNGANTIIENFGMYLPGLTTAGYPIMFNTIVAPGDSINLIMPSGTGSASIGTLIVTEIESASGSISLRNI